MQHGAHTLYLQITLSLSHLQKYKEYLNGSNLIVKLQAKHDLLKQTLGEGETLMVYNASPIISYQVSG